ncbi:FAD-dependent oxidoreductase [Methylobacterium nodulans]|uniref:FAD-dependent pyridine nucleotide-disulphide oxidoreductase n=1 Tax=Methylobacterium nodulans (strain LMG 21967 / CNCM I-2342 / ORS 2060) TaxID=460265 RepID=B8IHF5_METNO|nr:FAD-dependent oxidoreductase [Methylobacterium nodulans]ACL61618.1 FAD-dependent pyridine nucleotide-disulphide oxidoreductase [Methylobacterium nodulans ORS 2060]
MMTRNSSALDVAIVGAGPYGLSLAAHLREQGVEFRIFGEPMGLWKDNMPKNMLLKSCPQFSNIADPEDEFTIKSYCAEQSVPYHNELIPLPLERFVQYGDAFHVRYVPMLERKRLVSVELATTRWRAHFDDGETVEARRLVLAIGLRPFRHLPEQALHLSAEVASHSSDYGPLASLDGKEVVIVGSGASATDLAALIHERGARVTLVMRQNEIRFAGRPRQRSLLERMLTPRAGIGSGWTIAACSAFPELIHALPAAQRLRLANTPALGPAGGAFMHDRVLGKVPVVFGRSLERAEERNGKVELYLNGPSGRQVVAADHVIFATGYKTDIARFDVLPASLVGRMATVECAPQLSSHYETSLPGLHVIGPAAANSFGPVCRFVYGTRYPARHLARYLPRILARRSVIAPKLQPLSETVLQQ